MMKLRQQQKKQQQQLNKQISKDKIKDKIKVVYNICFEHLLYATFVVLIAGMNLDYFMNFIQTGYVMSV